MSEATTTAETSHPRLTFHLSPDPARLQRARERVRDYLAAHCEDSRLVNDVVLCIEEACTNTIRHSASTDDISISLQLQDGDLVASVRDKGRGFDVERFDASSEPDLLAPGGRGLYLMAKLMDELELRRDAGLEVVMRKRQVACRDLVPLESRVGMGSPGVSDARTRGLLEEISEAFIALDWEYRFGYANAAAEQLLGKPREELLGQAIWGLWPDAGQPLREAFAGAMELGRSAIIEYEARTLGRWIEVRVYPSAAGIGVYGRDITERRRRERERDLYEGALRERARLAEALEAVNQLIHSALSIDGVIERALQLGVDALRAEAATLEQREGETWFVRYQRGLSPEALGTELAREEAPLATRAAATREPVTVEDIAAEPEVDTGVIRAYRAKACLAVPLLSPDQVNGCLLFHYSAPRRFTDASVDFAKKFGSSVSLALENARLREREGEDAHLRSALSEGLLGRIVSRSRLHPLWVLLVACSFEVGFLLAMGAANSTRHILGLPGSLMALTVVIAGALAGWAVGVTAAALGSLVFFLTVGGMGELSSPYATAASMGIWIAAAVVASLLADGLRAQAERRKAAAVALARAVAQRETQLAERRRIEALAADLEAEREQLRTIIEQTDNSIVFLDRDFNFVLVNSAYAHTCGYEPEEMIGLNHFALYPDEENEAVFRQVRETGTPVEFAAKPFSFPDQPERGVTYWDWHLSPTMDDAGEIGGFVFSLIEVTVRVRSQRFSEALNLINTAVNAQLERDVALEEVLRLAGEALDCQSAVLIVPSKDGFIVTHSWNMPDQLAGQRVTPDNLPCAPLALARRRTVFPLQDLDGAQARLAHLAGARVAIPLVAGTRALGVIVQVSDDEHRRYGEIESDFAQNVGAIVTQALENSRLFREQQFLALTLQEHLVHALPAVPGVEFGRVSMAAAAPALVGGDFSDVFVVDPSRFLVFIGDVAGKGVQAAGLTETVRTAIGSFSLTSASPASILGRANELLLRGDDHEKPFVTVFLALVDLADGQVTFASAGHPAPARVAGDACGFLDTAPGLPLGSLSSPYQESRTRLKVGEGLVLYTDGVTEARRHGELYGEDRLLACLDRLDGLHPQGLADALRDDASAFAGELKDDLQILAFRML